MKIYNDKMRNVINGFGERLQQLTGQDKKVLKMVLVIILLAFAILIPVNNYF